MQRSLFGGAITCLIPPDFRDVSEIRQVPDHQECWQDVEGGRLLVIELLERQPVDDDGAAAHFFEDLADADSNAAHQRTFVPLQVESAQRWNAFPASTKICWGVGLQLLKVGRDVDVAGNQRHQECKAIRVELCVIRLMEMESDILITLSSPSDPNNPEGQPSTSPLFQQSVTSFRILDWGLFA